MRNPFVRTDNASTDINGRFQLARLNPRPARSNPAFADLSDEELKVAQRWHDEAMTGLKEAQEAKQRADAYFESPEGQAERRRAMADLLN